VEESDETNEMEEAWLMLAGLGERDKRDMGWGATESGGSGDDARAVGSPSGRSADKDAEVCLLNCLGVSRIRASGSVAIE
jgi:hypothetical protein